MRLRRYSWLYLLLAFSFPVFSADSYYSTPINASTPKYYGATAFAAANSACRAIFPPTGSWTMTGQPTADVGRWECRHGAVGGYYVAGNVYVYEVCSSGATSYAGQCSFTPNGEPCGASSVGSGVEKIKNSQGQCVEPWESDKPSFCKYLSRNTRFQTVPVQYREDGTVIPPPSITSVEGCEATPLDFSNCKMPVARKACANGNCVTLQPLQGNCRVATNFTGNVANNSVPSGQFTGSPGNAPGLCKPGEDCIGPTPPDVTNNQPCTYTTDAEGRKVCTSFNFNGKPGNGFSCGTFNGEMKCYGKVPNSTGSQITTTVSTQNQPNGNTTTTTTNNYQNTVCSAPGACTTTTTTTTNINVKGPTGDTISNDTTCTGPHCNPNGAGGKGDSNGDGIKDDGEEGEGIGGQDWYQAGDKTYGDVIGGFSERVSDLPSVQGVGNFLTFTPSGACPVYQVSTSVWDIRLDHWCRDNIPWPLISSVVMGLFATIAFRIAFL